MSLTVGPAFAAGEAEGLADDVQIGVAALSWKMGGREALAVAFMDIEAAAKRIESAAMRTPVIESPALNERMNARIFIKPECLQRSGSFKFRGAYNRLSQFTAAERQAGVVAWSSGNHAQGVAAAASLLGVSAAIVMPEDAPRVKTESTRAYGAEIIPYDRYNESREEIGARLARERNAVLAPSYDDPHIIAGQGTCGLEFARQMRERGDPLDALLVCCGGGGLIAGVSIAFKKLSPDTDVYSVEPDGFDDHARSLKTGRREKNDPDARSICDALLAPQPGALTFPINRETLSGGLSVSDDDVRAAMRYAFSTLKLVIEPGGAVALAALLARKIPVDGRRIGIVISGGNVDPELFSQILMDD